MDVSQILSCLEDVHRSGKGWAALCPAHDDDDPSLSINVGEDGCILLHCFVGCSVEAIVQRLGLSMSDLFPSGSIATRTRKKGDAFTSQESDANVQTSGCTLEEYAKAKRLPMDFLLSQGLSEICYLRHPAVRIPYIDKDGTELAVRFRIGLSGKRRFKWKSGAKPQLYGLNRLKSAQEAGEVVLVEGESDCHTLWRHGIPALGVPGASNWRENRDCQYFEGLSLIYVLIEPDRGGETLINQLALSSIRDRVHIIRLDDF